MEGDFLHIETKERERQRETERERPCKPREANKSLALQEHRTDKESLMQHEGIEKLYDPASRI